MPDHFIRCNASIRYTMPCTLERALTSCPPGWHDTVRKIFRLVATAGGRVWDCEPKYAMLHLGVELPNASTENGTDVLADELNDLVSAVDAICGACGNAGVLRNERQWCRVLCDPCESDVSTVGWWVIRARYIDA
jgi:hypothetical protein